MHSVTSPSATQKWWKSREVKVPNLSYWEMGSAAKSGHHSRATQMDGDRHEVSGPQPQYRILKSSPLIFTIPPYSPWPRSQPSLGVCRYSPTAATAALLVAATKLGYRLRYPKD